VLCDGPPGLGKNADDPTDLPADLEAWVLEGAPAA
jgi:hypothetical protein